MKTKLVKIIEMKMYPNTFKIIFNYIGGYYELSVLDKREQSMYTNFNGLINFLKNEVSYTDEHESLQNCNNIQDLYDLEEYIKLKNL